MSAPYVLVVDDERDIRELIKEILEDEGYEVGMAEDAASARQALRQHRPDLILLDVWLPGEDGISLLKEWSTAEGGLVAPVIMISGHGTVETAVEATRLGAYDFVEKPLSLSKLLLVVQRALEAERLRRENVGLRAYVRPLREPIGDSAVMEELRNQVKRIAQHNAWVLIRGEPGSGKELFARYLHGCSPRAEQPFVEVGVPAISGEDAARELFGSEEGGRIRYGYLEQANGGTLFLSEVADMDAAVQAKLLGSLETRTFLRVGGNVPVEFDVRVVAATHRDLEEEVRAGRFREDLYYQLNVVPLHIPPLREHSEDIPPLLEHYVEQFASQEGLPYRRFAAPALKRLCQYHWPGNVRELKNLVQRLLILSRGEEIGLEDVEVALGVRKQAVAEIPIEFDAPLRAARKQFEKAYFEHQLEVNAGNVSKVAQVAGIERTHLYRKLRELGLK
ncbi:MAG TPA: sigma-54-dependent Fis family transcriptional regulator [Gammaproteobacteria bacterium]|nr:sigma-54-dependent Fis family transcriptional regulator [Gammaproteobacteria bacterium]